MRKQQLNKIYKQYNKSYLVHKVYNNDYFYIISKKHYLIINELMAEDLEKNMLIQVNEYEDPQKIISIEKIYSVLNERTNERNIKQ